MSALFRAEVLDVRPKAARIALSIVSAEAKRLWNTKSFGLWMLLEPIFLRVAPAGAVTELVPLDAVLEWSVSRLRPLAPKVVTSVVIDAVEPAIPAHLEALRALSSADEIKQYFSSGRAPRGTFTIRLKRDHLADHLRVGMQWSSAACDMGGL